MSRQFSSHQEHYPARAGLGKSVFQFISVNNHPANATRYYGSGGSVAGAENGVEFVMPYDCIVRNMRCHSTVAPGVGDSYIFTFRAGGDTALTATIADLNTLANDLVNNITVLAGTICSLKVVSSVTATVNKVNATIEIEAI